MIATLTGTVKLTGADHLVVDVGGVGYEVFASLRTLQALSPSERAELFIYTHVKEDILKLYGFLRLEEKTLFVSFLGINGVGPKTALSILSAAPSLEDLLNMIDREEVEKLSRLPRIGKKTAGQMILNLKGKLKSQWIQTDPRTLKHRQDLRAALSGLGFRTVEIQEVLDNMKLSSDSKQNLKKALAYLQPEVRVSKT